MFNPKIQRAWAGVQIEGVQFTLQLGPKRDNRIGAIVIAEPALTGFDRPARMTNDEFPTNYLVSEMIVRDTEFACHQADDLMPFFKCGFSITLEPGMAPALRKLIPLLGESAKLYGAVVSHAEPIFRAQEPPLYADWGFDLFSHVASNIVLDGLEPAEAIMRERRAAQFEYFPRWTSDGYAPLWAMLESPEVQSILAAAYKVRTSTALAL